MAGREYVEHLIRGAWAAASDPSDSSFVGASRDHRNAALDVVGDWEALSEMTLAELRDFVSGVHQGAEILTDALHCGLQL